MIHCIQFQQNYGECPPDYDQYFISQKLKLSSKNAEQAQYRVNRLFQALSFFQVCLQF